MAEQLKMIRTSAPVKEIPLPEGYSYESCEGGLDQISPIGHKYQKDRRLKSSLGEINAVIAVDLFSMYT